MRAEGSPWAYEQLPKRLKYDVEILRELVNNLSFNYNDEIHFINTFDTYHIPPELLADDNFVVRLAEIYECTEKLLVLSKELVLRMIELGVCNTDILDEELLDDPDVQSNLAKFAFFETGEDD